MFKKTRLYIELKYIYYFLLSEIKYMFSKHILNYEMKEKNIFLFMTADYGNLGDVAISLAEIKYLKDNFRDYNIVEIPFGSSFNEIKYIKKRIKHNDIVTIVGGGNMTNRFETFEIVRRLICKKFKNNIIVFFPQTVDYTSDYSGEKSKKTTIKYINKVNKKLVSVREKTSFDYLKDKVSNVYLIPDIVMYNIGKINFNEKKTDKIGFCFRNDLEINKNNNSLISSIKEYYNNYNIVNFDTHVGDDMININNREEKLMDLLKKISKMKVVITDRLHCMIFCCITNTPCIVLDNSNHKIQNVYNTWLKTFKNILFVKNKEDISNKKIDKLYMSNATENFDKEFNLYTKKIKELVEEEN